MATKPKTLPIPASFAIGAGHAGNAEYSGFQKQRVANWRDDLNRGGDKEGRKR
jgi:hypothetical protein